MTRILVIEDNPENMELMTYLLKAHGYVTEPAWDGEAGLELAVSHPPDLIVCDVHLPKMDGYEVARRAKSAPTLRRVPLIAVTALAMVGDRDRLLAAGFDGYIAKPVNPRAFVTEIEGFMRKTLWSEPPAPGPTPPPTPPSPPAEPRAVRARVLVVDDARANRDLVGAVLQPLGYAVTVAANVSDALVQLRAADSRFDLVISDVHMPQDDGFELLARVKAEPSLREIPFMFLSSSVWGERDRMRALQMKATSFVLRPIEPRRLIEEVEKCLGQPRQGP